MRLRTPSPLAVSFFVLSLCLFSQAQKGGGSTGTTRSAPNTGTMIPNPMNPTIVPMTYSGHVLIDGAAPLTDAVKIIARCTGGKGQPNSVYQTYTDLKGRFSFTVGQRDGVPIDASVNSNEQAFGGSNNNLQLVSCDVVASAPGFIPSQITVQFRSSLDNMEFGKLVLTPVGGGVNLGGIVSVTTLSAPDNAQREYAKALQDLRDKKIDKAEKHLLKAVEQYPKFAVAWFKLAQIAIADELPQDARKSLQSAMDADPKFIPPFVDMAILEAGQNQWDSVRSLTAHAIDVDPSHFPDAYYLQAVADYNLKYWSDAERAALKALELDRQHQFPRVHLLLAQLYSGQGRREAAADQFKKYLSFDQTSKEADAARQKLAKLEPSPAK